ncbi:MAG: AEC family transporter [Ignavibacteriaceae bacterium]|nr:AEC family transporter [Ignavibacteriaceae bacterium]
MIDNIIFTGNVIAPVFLLVALGYFVKRINVINENFVEVTSKFVYSVSLPALVFINIARIDLSEAIEFDQIIYVYAATLISFFLIWIFSIPFIKDGKNLSVFVQGAYRSNFAIVGLAIISKLFGAYALGKAAIVLAFILPLYNILAVIILTVPLRKERKLDMKSTAYEILFNPLIIAVIVGLPFSYYKIELPYFINLTIGFLSELALPLALIGIGGSLNIQNIKKSFRACVYILRIKNNCRAFTLNSWRIPFWFQRIGFGDYVYLVCFSDCNSKLYYGRSDGCKRQACRKYCVDQYCCIGYYNCIRDSNSEGTFINLKLKSQEY